MKQESSCVILFMTRVSEKSGRSVVKSPLTLVGWLVGLGLGLFPFDHAHVFVYNLLKNNLAGDLKTQQNGRLGDQLRKCFPR